MSVSVQAAAAATVLLALSGSTARPALAQPPAPGRTVLMLPGGRAGLFPRLGLRPDVPRALAIGTVIRLVHASHRSQGPAYASLRAYLAAPSDTPDEGLPLPMTAAFWRSTLANPPVEDADLLGAVLSDRNASLLCYGLLALDHETLGAVSAHAELLEALRSRLPGAFAAFPATVRLLGGRLVLPGGPDAAPVWEALLGASPTDPVRAIPALLSRDDGRLAYFVDTLWGLDASKRNALLGDPALPAETRISHVQSVYRAFRSVEPGWEVEQFPFLRMGFDPALFVLEVGFDDEGRLPGSERFWRAVFDGTAVPDDPAEAFGALDGPDASVSWMLGELAGLPYPERQDRFRIVFFVERMRARMPDRSPAELVALSHAFKAAPALLLSLERAGIIDAQVSLAAGRRAAAIVRGGGNAAARDTALALFQGPLVLIELMTRRGALSPASARDLVAVMAAGPAGDARAVGRLFHSELLPALGMESGTNGVTIESLVLEALAGTAAPVPPELRGARVTWEGLEYRIDPAVPELVRLSDVRVRQRGNTLDDALELARLGGHLASATADEVEDLAERLGRLATSLEPIEPSELPGVPAPPDVRAAVDRAHRELASAAPSDRARIARTAARRLELIERAVLADVLMSLVYATAIGDPGGRLFLAGNVARRHDFGTQDRSRSDRERTPWLTPWEMSGSGDPWHVRGSLLTLDVGLAQLGLRRTSLGLPDSRPTLSEMDRRVLLTTQALGTATSFDAAEASRIVAWLREGRRRLASLGGVVEANRLADRIRLDAHRRQALAWSVSEDRAAVPLFLLNTELVLLGRPADAPALSSAWGVAQTPVTGCLCLAFPDPPALQHYLDRPAGGLLASRIADLTLAVLEGLADLELPVVLLHGTLDSALYDFLNEAQLAYPDDWWAFAAIARTVTPTRLVDYVSALTAGGPLVPVSRVSDDRP